MLKSIILKHFDNKTQKGPQHKAEVKLLARPGLVFYSLAFGLGIVGWSLATYWNSMQTY